MKTELQRKQEKRKRKLQIIFNCCKTCVCIVLGVIVFLHITSRMDSQSMEVVAGQKEKQEEEQDKGVYAKKGYPDTAGTIQDGTHSNEWAETEKGTRYYTEQAYYADGWKEIDKKRYYFDSEGYRMTGWINPDGNMYYLEPDGIWNETVKPKLVAMTFDDGPGASTNLLLDLLEQNHARATFFIQGKNVESYPDTLSRMLKLGCQMGNHSFDHPDFTTLSIDEVKSEIQKTDEVIQKYTGTIPKIVRCPYGAANDEILAAVGRPCIYWTLDTEDWKTRNVESNTSAVLDHVQDGDIVLMHDIHLESVEACRVIIPELIKKGYQMVTVQQLAKLRGVQLGQERQYGTKYEFYAKETDTESPHPQS